jgi:hypothetical protein
MIGSDVFDRHPKLQVREVRVASEAEALLQVLENPIS